MADQMNGRMCPLDGSARSAQTPHLNQLAGSGTNFRHAYCNNPLCTPSRMSMLTGRLISNLQQGYDNSSQLSSEIPTFAHLFQSAGHQCILSGKMHFVGADQHHGFHERLTTDIYPADFSWVPAPWGSSDKTHPSMGINAIQQAKISESNFQIRYDTETHACAKRRLMEMEYQEQPFFFCVSYTHPHSPYQVPKRYYDLYQDEDIPLPYIPENMDKLDTYNQILANNCNYNGSESMDTYREVKKIYFAMCSYVDDLVGDLIQTLKDTGQYENTLIVFTSDHGEMMGQHGMFEKRTYFEDSLRVPLLFSHPSLPAQTCDSPVSLIDLFPSFIDLFKLNWPQEALQGTSLAKVINGECKETQHTVISEYFGEAINFPFRAAIKGNYKYVNFPGENGEERLVDVANDYNELQNLVDDNLSVNEYQTLKDELSNGFNYPHFKKSLIENQKNRRLLRSLYANYRPDWNCMPDYPAHKLYKR